VAGIASLVEAHIDCGGEGGEGEEEGEVLHVEKTGGLGVVWFVLDAMARGRV
jgi:hypothetical protein